jgi:hypothetical protein
VGAAAADLPADRRPRRRGASVRVGAVLLGALISKLVYAALLAIVLFGTTVIAKLGGSGDDVTAWMALLGDSQP